MTALCLAASLIAVLYGGAVCARRKQPLFFKILLFGCVSFFVGSLFEGCYTLVTKAPPVGFHVGCLGYMGAFFFLLSAYFGALDSLADGGERELRGYRLAALLAPLALVGICAYSVLRSGATANIEALVLIIPMSLTGYFALKHLILPDVEMGIIRVMRPYNACVLLFLLCETAARLPFAPDTLLTAARCGGCLLLIILLPVAESGVRKWFT